MDGRNMFLGTTDDHILSPLSQQDLVQVALTSRAGREAVAWFSDRAYWIELFLSPYFTPVEYLAFRRIQAETGMLISGSNTLQFLDHCRYEKTNLDLYLNHRHLSSVHNFLVAVGYSYIEGEGRSFNAVKVRLDDMFNIDFQFQKRVASGNYCGRGLFVVLSYQKDVETKIDVVTTTFCPFQVILSFHSTCVMNVITYAHAVSLYPRATFIDHVSYRNMAVRVADETAFAKYEAWGFTYITREQALSRREFRLQRQVGDRFCWILPLHAREPPPECLLQDFVFANCWGIAEADSILMFEFIVVRSLSHPELSVCFPEGKWNSLIRHLGGSSMSNMPPPEALSLFRRVIRGSFSERTMRIENYLVA